MSKIVVALRVCGVNMTVIYSLQKADLVMLPIFSEDVLVVLIAAMAVGHPVVVSSEYL